MTTLPTAKFQLLTIVPLPADCVACGRKSDGSNEFVDLTKDIDYYGAILLCRECAEEIAVTVNFVKEQDAELDAIRVENTLLEEIILSYDEKVQALERVVFAYGIDALAAFSEPTSGMVAIEIKEQGSKLPTEPKSRPVKSTASK